MHLILKDPEAAPGAMEGQQFLFLKHDELYVRFLSIAFMLFPDERQMMGDQPRNQPSSIEPRY